MHYSFDIFVCDAACLPNGIKGWEAKPCKDQLNFEIISLRTIEILFQFEKCVFRKNIKFSKTEKILLKSYVFILYGEIE